jgi:hypothetical protein
MATLTPGTARREGLSRSGVCLPADAPTADWDQLEAATRRADATICLASVPAR